MKPPKAFKKGTDHKNENRGLSPFLKQNLSAYSLGFSIPAAMAILTYLGYLLDQKWGGSVWTFTGMFLGLFYCGYEIWKLVKKSNEEKN